MSDDYDVTVVGAGIHGAGVAQAAAAMGYRTLVLEETAVACMVSASIRLGALPGPPLVITMVKVTNDPAFTEAGELMVIPRSDNCTKASVTAFEGCDSAPVPVAFVAWTVKV